MSSCRLRSRTHTRKKNNGKSEGYSQTHYGLGGGAPNAGKKKFACVRVFWAWRLPLCPLLRQAPCARMKSGTVCVAVRVSCTQNAARRKSVADAQCESRVRLACFVSSVPGSRRRNGLKSVFFSAPLTTVHTRRSTPKDGLATRLDRRGRVVVTEVPES